MSARLLSISRRTGKVVLTALDAAARGLFVTQYIVYDGLADVQALQAGVARCSENAACHVLNGLQTYHNFVSMELQGFRQVPSTAWVVGAAAGWNGAVLGHPWQQTTCIPPFSCCKQMHAVAQHLEHLGAMEAWHTA